MNIIKKDFPEGKRRWKKDMLIRKVEKIVLHDPGSNQSFNEVYNFFINDEKYSRIGSYHDIIEKDTVYHLIDYNFQANHCGIFGGSNYNLAMWGEVARTGFQNLFSVGVNIIRPFEESMNTSVQHVAKLCLKFNLNPYRDIICHFHIDDKLPDIKKDPIFFYQEPVKLDYFRLLVDKEMRK